MLHKNKRAEVGETITWFVATLVIVVFLAISIFVVSLIKHERNFNTFQYSDSVVAKSLSGFLLTQDGEEIIFDKISESENPKDYDLTEFSGKLSVKVFRELYNNIYSQNIILAIPGTLSDSSSSTRSKYWSGTIGDCNSLIQEKICFTGNKCLKLCLDKYVR